MMQMSSLLYLSLVPICVVAGLVGFAGWIAKDSESRFCRAGEWLGITCLALTLATWLLRWYLAGHLPIFGTYESALSLAVAVLAAMAVARVLKGSALLWPVSCSVAAALLAHGLRFDAAAFPLTISERSWIVEVHAVAAWTAFGCLATNAALALAWLLGGEKTSPRTSRLLRLSLSLGFLLHSAMLASGSFYKFLLFGETWSFDPIESLGFVTWISYGAVLHLHLMAGWEGDRLARWCLAVFILLTISYRAIVYFPAWSTYHIFDMDLRIHIVPSDSPDPGGGD